MRRIKAIYLIPVYIVLLAGAAFAEYYMLIIPQMEKTTKAHGEWKKARDACKSEESKYQPALDLQVENSRRLLDNYYTFHAIQNSMPKLYNMGELYKGKEREGMVAMYRMMSTPQLPNELRRWANGFHLKYTDPFKFTGTLGFEDTLTSVKAIEFDFGEQTFTAYGYADLVKQVQRKSGYGYFPLIIAPKEENVTITVDEKVPYNPRKPRLLMPYTAKGYCFTRGWDPNGAAAKDEVAKAQALLQSPPQAQPPRQGFASPWSPPPLMFWYLPPKDVEP